MAQRWENPPCSAIAVMAAPLRPIGNPWNREPARGKPHRAVPGKGTPRRRKIGQNRPQSARQRAEGGKSRRKPRPRLPPPARHGHQRSAPFAEPRMKRLSIVLVEKLPERAALIAEALGRDHDLTVIDTDKGLARRIADLAPDLVLIDLANPSRDVLEELSLASSPMERPVAMFVDRSDQGLTRAAIEAGVSAYVVDGLRAERITPILDAAIARFHMFQRIRAELAATRAALEERKIIDRAKGILMKAKGIGEDEAYALMRRGAMDQKRKIIDMAQAIITAAELLK